MSDFFEKLKTGAYKTKDEAVKIGKHVIDKANGAVNVAKLNYAINDTENKIKDIYAEVGKKLYMTRETGKLPEDEINKSFEKIDKLISNIRLNGYNISILERLSLLNFQGFTIQLSTKTLFYSVDVGLGGILIFKRIPFGCTKKGFIILDIIFIFTIKIMLTIEIDIGIIIPFVKNNLCTAIITYQYITFFPLELKPVTHFL